MDEIAVRPARPDDQDAIITLLRTSLGKQDDEHYEGFLRWKHEANPFGASPAWVATDGSQVIGYRTLLRWQFLDQDGRTVRAVRAVDTATSPAYRGRGIFRQLTLRAVADLTVAGDAFVFNTPNDQSRPGYLSMGWSILGRLPVGVWVSGATSGVGLVRARTAARLWSESTTAGEPAPDALADDALVNSLLQHAPTTGLRTRRHAEYLRWRTAFPPLNYRVLFVSSDPAEGGVIFRLRRRGTSVEAAVVEQFVPDERTAVQLTRRVLRLSGANYAIGLRTTATSALVPLPRQGPILTARPLARAVPSRRAWGLTLGDVELF